MAFTPATVAQVRGALDNPRVAQLVERVLSQAIPSGCGRKDGDDALCRVRLVLQIVGAVPNEYYKETKQVPYGRDGIKILQRALGVGADGIWGPGTNGALKAKLESVLGRTVVADATQREHVVNTGGGGGDSVPEEDIPGGGSGLKLAGIPWFIPAGLAVAAVGSYFLFRTGKKRGLEGCDCNAFNGPVDDHEYDEDHIDPAEVSEELEGPMQAVQSLPSFPTLRS